MAVLVLAEHDHATVHPATLHTITAAAQLGGEVTVLLAGENCGAAATAAAAATGALRRRPRRTPRRQPQRRLKRERP